MKLCQDIVVWLIYIGVTRATFGTADIETLICIGFQADYRPLLSLKTWAPFWKCFNPDEICHRDSCKATLHMQLLRFAGTRASFGTADIETLIILNFQADKRHIFRLRSWFPFWKYFNPNESWHRHIRYVWLVYFALMTACWHKS